MDLRPMVCDGGSGRAGYPSCLCRHPKPCKHTRVRIRLGPDNRAKPNTDAKGGGSAPAGPPP